MEQIIPYNGSKPYIFISYSHRNTPEVLTIIRRLIDDGYRVWYDEGITPGNEWDDDIATHVDACGCMLAMISSEYLESENCKDELDYARDLDKPRLLIYLEEVSLPGGMRMRLGRLQAIFKFSYADQNKFYGKLYEADLLAPCKKDPDEIDNSPDPSLKTPRPGENKFSNTQSKVSSGAAPAIPEKTEYCTQCGTSLPANAVVCPKCGKAAGKSNFCTQCGSSLPANAILCPQCGKSVQASGRPTFCTQCGMSIPANAPSCPRCGKSTGVAPVQKTEYCTQCGTALPANAEKCPKCGKSAKAPVGPPFGKYSKGTIALICFFLGAIGIHNFMLGENKKGLMKIAFFILFFYVSPVLALIDFIKIVTDKYEVDPNKYF